MEANSGILMFDVATFGEGVNWVILLMNARFGKGKSWKWSEDPQSCVPWRYAQRVLSKLEKIDVPLLNKRGV